MKGVKYFSYCKSLFNIKLIQLIFEMEETALGTFVAATEPKQLSDRVPADILKHIEKRCTHIERNSNILSSNLSLPDTTTTVGGPSIQIVLKYYRLQHNKETKWTRSRS